MKATKPTKAHGSEHLRDIDPSCTLRSTPGGTSWVGHSPEPGGDRSHTTTGTRLKVSRMGEMLQ